MIQHYDTIMSGLYTHCAACQRTARMASFEHAPGCFYLTRIEPETPYAFWLGRDGVEAAHPLNGTRLWDNS